MNEFVQAKQQLLSIHEPLLNLAKSYESKWVENKISQLQSRLNKEAFEIMVIGEFSNGKSTLINALLGDEILPASLRPTTTILNRIVYQELPTFTLHYENGKKKKITRESFTKLVAPNPKDFKNEAALQDYVEEVILPIRHAEIGYPTDLCKEDVVLIDSPGMNDNDELREAVTTNYIPKSDAAIFVINARKALSQTEMDLMKRLYTKDITKVFFVLNFADVLKEAQRQEVYDFVYENLLEFTSEPKIYFTAARSALIHHRLNNGETLDRKLTRRLITFEETGIQKLKDDLLQFLIVEKGLEKIHRAVDGYEQVITQFGENTIQFEIDSLQNDAKKIEQQIAEITAKLKELPGKLEKSRKNASKVLEREKTKILMGYKSELYDISKIAQGIMTAGMRDKRHPETIKADIEAAVGSQESKITEQLQKKIKKLLEKMMADQANELNAEFEIIYNHNSYILPSYNSWDYEITLARDNRNYGGFFRGIFEVFAPTLVEKVDDYTDRRSLEKGYTRLREQVNDRFITGVEKRLTVAEKTMDMMFIQAQEALLTEITEQMEDEKIKNERALKNSQQDSKELDFQLTTMNNDLKMLGQYKEQINHIYAQYEAQVNTYAIN